MNALAEKVKLLRPEQIQPGDSVWEPVRYGKGDADAHVKLKAYKVLTVERAACTVELQEGDRRRIKLHFKKLVCDPKPDLPREAVVLTEVPREPDPSDPMSVWKSMGQEMVDDLTDQIETLEWELQANKDQLEVDLGEKRRAITKMEDELKKARQDLEQERKDRMALMAVTQDGIGALRTKRASMEKALELVP